VRRFGATRALDGLSFTVGSRPALWTGRRGRGRRRPRLFARWPASSRWTRAAALCWAAIRRKAGLPCASRSGSCLNRRACTLIFRWAESALLCPPVLPAAPACFVSVRRRLLEITRLQPFLDRRADACRAECTRSWPWPAPCFHRPDVLLLDEPHQRRGSRQSPRTVGPAARAGLRRMTRAAVHALHGRGRALSSGGTHPSRPALARRRAARPAGHL